MEEGLKNIRVSIAAVALALVAFGIVMVYSASAIYALEKLNDSAYFLKRHAAYALIAVLCAIAVIMADMKTVRNSTRPVIAVAVLLLIAVLVPGIGREVGGARRWIVLGPVQFQPAEVAKLGLILYMADFLDRRKVRVGSVKDVFVPAMIVIGCVSALILAQPDLGSAVALAAIGLVMLFAAGARMRHLLVVLLIGAFVLTAAIASMPYRRARITAFVNPWKDPRGSGFQIIQSLVALGSGGLTGVGLGESRQKLFYLPESHTDFIFSIIGEEAGFAGAAAVTALFLLLVWQGMRVAFKKSALYSQLVAAGISCLFGLEAVINIGVATGMLPTKGLPLPFISYGGTSLVLHMVMIGLLLNVARDEVV